MSRSTRVVRVAGLAVIGVVFAAFVVTEQVELLWRAISVLGLVSVALAVRTIVGPVVVVSPTGLRIQRNWPVRTHLAWYRIFTVDVEPMRWVLQIEMNNGDRIELPAVQELSDLYERIEAHRANLDTLDA